MPDKETVRLGGKVAGKRSENCLPWEGGDD